jgi:alpha-tubulin suppressor-like RCC1 family protein
VTAALAAGGGHSLEIRADGTLHGWGANASGQLGDGSTMTRPTPVPVSLPAGVTALAVAAGGGHSLALGSDGELYAWGDNSRGQIGDGSTLQRTAPVQVSLPAGVSALAIAAGNGHSLAMGSDGTLYAWGNNDSGQLGDGSIQQRTTPVQVSLPVGVSALSVTAGRAHSLATGSDGRLYAWGSNSFRQIGDGSIASLRATPVQVRLSTGVSALSVTAGDDHSLAVGSDGNLYAWGSNSDGQRGDGSTFPPGRPVQVSLPAGVSALSLAAGATHSLAMGSDGMLYAWGGNSDGQLGDGSYTGRATRLQVSLPAGVSALGVAAGGVHTLAMGSDGTLYAWGGNEYGQLGDGSAAFRTPPVRVSLPAGVSALDIAASGDHSLALSSDGTLYAWGGNAVGQLGDGSTSDRTTPVAVSLPAGVSSLGVEAGASHSLVAASDGRVYAWGENRYGELGDGSTLQRTAPVQVSLPAAVSALAVAAGTFHSVARGSDGTLYAWGSNGYGQLGDRSTLQRTAPVSVNLPPGVSTLRVTAGRIHTLAQGSDGKLYAWGNNLYGQLGDGGTTARPTPLPVVFPTGVSALGVAAGQYHNLARGSDGKLYAWGDNGSGQLGNGSTAYSSTPMLVSLPAGVSALSVAAGDYHSLALGSDGKLYAWGRNYYGQLGGGSITLRTTPEPVSLPAGVSVVRLAAGFDHSLAAGSDGQVFAWGRNADGQLGNGVLRNSAVPLSVNTAQTISFAALPDLPLSAATIAVSASASSGLPVRFDSWTRVVCTVSGSTVTLLRTGICVVSADQDGDESRARADTVTQSFTVTGTAQTIIFAPLGNTWLGEAAPALVLSASSALPITLVSNTPGVCGVEGGGLTLLMIGTCQLTASQPGNASFEPAAPVSRSFTVSAARSAQSVSFTTLPALAKGASGALIASASSGLVVAFDSITPDTCAVSGSSLTAVSTGLCTVSASQPGNASFRPASTVTQSVQIGGNQGGGGEDGDVPLPGWALAALGMALVRAAMQRRSRKNDD